MSNYTKTEDKYNLLMTEYAILKEQYDKLKTETSENTVIQSMNDMKEQYDRVIQTTVPIYRFKMVEERYNLLTRTCEAAVVVLEHSISKISKINRLNHDEKLLRKSEMEMIIVKDLICDAVSNK